MSGRSAKAKRRLEQSAQAGSTTTASSKRVGAHRAADNLRRRLAKGRRGVTPEEIEQLTPLTRLDLGWAGVTAAVGAILFATVLTSHPGLGDAPESVAGTMSLGVLHAPGYPTYVLMARAFTLLCPFGAPAFRVNLFSLVCASLSVGGVQLLARRFGAARWAASLGALVLAAGAGFWFYAGFAKHDMLSGLLFLSALHLLLAWQARPTSRKLLALSVLVGFGLGSSWPLVLLLMPTIAFVLVRSRRGLTLRSATVATVCGLLVVVALYGFVMFRAEQGPVLNWGGATTVSRLVELVSRADFTPQGTTGAAATGALRSAASAAGHQSGSSLLKRVETYVVLFWQELGTVGVALAALGLILSLGIRRRVAAYPLLITFAVNLIAAAVLVGGANPRGYDLDLIEEGFLFGCYFTLACWVAVAATQVMGWAGSTRDGKLAARAREGWRRALRPAAISLVAAALLVPSVIMHWSVAHRTTLPFADRYAVSMFNELPPRAAVFILGAELTQPLIYRQVIYHERRDVAVIAADGLSYPWYREQLSRRLGIHLPRRIGSSIADAERVVKLLSATRPVYLDPQAAEAFQSAIAYRPVGLLASLVAGRGVAPVSSATQLDARFRQAERAAQMPNSDWSVWPNKYLAFATYSTAALQVARAYFDAHDLAGLRRSLQNVLSISPGDAIARNDLAAIGN